MGGVRGPGGPGSDPAPAKGSQVLAPASPSEDSSRGAQPSLPVAIVERTLDGTVVGLSLWTVIYHLCLVLRWDVGASLLLMLLSTAGLLMWSWARRGSQPEAALRPAAEPPPHQGWPSARGSLVLPTVVVAAVAGLAFALQLPWAVVAVAWLAAAGLGTLAAWRSTANGRDPVPSALDRPDAARRERTSLLVALGCGLVVAAISVTMLRSNPDDVYYVNLSQWVAEHGSFPLRDTIYGDLVYPMTSWPPMASYDALVGAVAHLLNVRAATVVYEVVPPLVAVLSVLALWRLLREWRVPAVGLALSVAVFFLLLDGGGPYSPGNVFVTRLWQGKVIYLGLVVPLLLVYASRHVARPSRSTLVRLTLGGIASVGLTTSAMFLTPVLAAAAMAPLARTRRRDALMGFAAMAAYPFGAAVVTRMVHGRSADDFLRKTYRFDPSWFGTQVFHQGLVAFLAVAAVLVAAVLLPSAPARLTVGLLAVVIGIAFVPGVTRLSFDLVGLGPTLWRLTWLVPVALLVGAAAVRTLTLLPRGRAQAVVGLVALAALAVLLRPIWADGDTSWHRPFHAQRPVDTVAMADQLINRLEPGATVLADQSLSITIAVFTTDIRTVSPRDYFLDALRDEPGFHAHGRARLAHFVEDNSSTWSGREVSRDLDLFSVDATCLRTEDEYGRPRSPVWLNTRLELLRSDGLTSRVRTDNYVCTWR